MATVKEQIAAIRASLQGAQSSLTTLEAMLTDSPTRSNVLQVNAGGNLQAAIDAAKPGDEIHVEPATYTGNFRLRNKGGGDPRAILIRPRGLENLPPAGARISPTDAAALFKLAPADRFEPVLATDKASGYWTIRGAEVLPNNPDRELVVIGSGSDTTLDDCAHHIALAQCYIHGDPTNGQRRGVAMHGATVVISGCHISDIKYRGFDSQGICGYNGPGPFVIENNYIEGSAENILIGGADPKIPNLVPSDIAILGNTLSKPMAWKTGASGWLVKNILELKSAQRVRIIGNLLENCWKHGQDGYGVLFTVRNQDKKAPWSTVRDVEFAFNVVRNVGSAISILGLDDQAPSVRALGIRIANNLCYDIGAQPGAGRFVQIGDMPDALTITHNTAMPATKAGSFMLLYGSGGNAFVMTDNVLYENEYGILGDNTGQGSPALAKHAPGGVFTRNLIAGYGRDRRIVYPEGNHLRSQPVGELVDPATFATRTTFETTDARTIGVDLQTLRSRVKF